MDVNYPGKKDPSPKRRKGEDNPYELFTVGIHTDHPQYFLAFVDGRGIRHCMEIGQTLYEAFNRFELDDLAHLNEVDRHYEKNKLPDNVLYQRAVQLYESVEETVLRQMELEALYRAIGHLPDKQRRRLVFYYFEGLTYEQIAAIERCSFQVVARTIKAAEKNLKKFLTKG